MAIVNPTWHFVAIRIENTVRSPYYKMMAATFVHFDSAFASIGIGKCAMVPPLQVALPSFAYVIEQVLLGLVWFVLSEIGNETVYE